MATPKDLPRDIGAFIRDLRRNARISLRQLAEQAGVSNPYLSQVERGLRKPSAEVLQQIASALRVSTPAMYLRAGLLDAKESQGVLAAIATDPDLTMAQRQSLTQIYETFRRENARFAASAASGAAGAGPDAPEAGPAGPEAGPAAAEAGPAPGATTRVGETPESGTSVSDTDKGGEVPAKQHVKPVRPVKKQPVKRQPMKKVATDAAAKTASAAEEENL